MLPILGAWVALHDYDVLARRVLSEIVEQHHAVIWQEVEARAADEQWATSPVPINPHHLSTARHQLIQNGTIKEITEETRGGRKVKAIVPVEDRGRVREVERTAARKRLLYARYLSWASGSKTDPQGHIGPGGEAIVHAALVAASPYGYRLVNPSGGQASMLLGQSVPGGTLDNAAFLTTVDAYTNTPSGYYLVTVEVKNVRHWLYPRHWEIYQLLHKSAALQRDHPDVDVVPVLVCRRAHHTTFNMASDLGFYVVQTRQQFMRPTVRIPQDRLDEVRDELHLRDLTMTDVPPPALVKHFREKLQTDIGNRAARWGAVAPNGVDRFQRLRNRSLDGPGRDEQIHRLREVAAEALGDFGELNGWGPTA